MTKNNANKINTDTSFEILVRHAHHTGPFVFILLFPFFVIPYIWRGDNLSKLTRVFLTILVATATLPLYFIIGIAILTLLSS
jgi:hypothetical protein